MMTPMRSSGRRRAAPVPGAAGAPAPPGTPRRVVLWVLVGIGLLQAVWIATLPPLRGADEVDHVLRASAVAAGDWSSPPTAATRGTGAVVGATAEMVDAATDACTRLDYKEPEECRLVPSPDGPGVASAAGRYNPTYYVLVGYVTKLADGVAGSYLMRGASALLCLLLLGAGLEGLRRWAPPRLFAGALLGLTPTVTYSTTVVAPNGLEIVAGLVLWTSLAGIARDVRGRVRYHVLTATLSLSGLLVLRSLGPLWALLILLLSLLAWPGLTSRMIDAVRSVAGVVAVLVAGTAAALGVTWTLSQRALVLSQDGPGGGLSLSFRLGRALQEVPLWLLQDVGAFPFRNQPAPLVVYPAFLALVVALGVVGARSGTTRLRRAVLLTLTASLAIPYVLTVLTMAEVGTAWQGRYAMPLLIGATVLLGAGWARSETPRLSARAAVLLGVTLLAVHVPGPVKVASEMAQADWMIASRAVPHAPVWVLAMVAVAGASLVSATVLRMVHRPSAAGEQRAGPEQR